MADEAKLDIERFKEWQKKCYFVFDSDQTRAGLKQFCIMRGGYKVLLNGQPLYSGSDLDWAKQVYDTAFANKLKT